MRGPGRHQHHGLGDIDLAHAMQHQRVQQTKGRGRLARDRMQALLGHARIMLQRHARDPAALIKITHQARETGDRAGPPAEVLALLMGLQFPPGVKRPGPELDPHLSPP